ncbi:dienelactone hydrolase family protein [Alkalisalibacterium limincola]|uniref:Dienelactone hydrolase family protein n=1 Tax=Alkalisalibacterium limincola TaxID=2699169 RepID=A0A5C8KRC0_9GAMM|nr:dienelactone hydrolase family protein [Alkalisalibacterium limincola]TXK62560.1 dienelactone hydrolase family protein [Alkalisalibacterium limincola]
MRRRILALACVLAAAPAFAAPEASPVSWTHDGETFSGFIVHDPTAEGDRPGLVMVPNWMGVNDSAVEKAKAIVERGYVVLVADMYGEGVRPTDTAEASAAARAVYGDRERARGRINTALDTLRAQEDVGLDTSKLGGIGFCFGGAMVLELARSGTDLGGVVSFHGSLDTSEPAAPGAVRTPMLVLNGADDPMVSAEEIAGFQEEMTRAGADWQFVNFAGAVHCFAESDADSGAACQYHERSAKRAYRMMDGFFEEVFAD